MSVFASEYFLNMFYSLIFANVDDIPTDETTIYLQPGAIRHRICNCDASTWIPDFNRIEFNLDQNNAITYYPGIGTIIDTFKLPPSAKIYFTNVSFVIVNISNI